MSDYLKKRQELIFQGRPLKQKKNYQLPKVSEKRKAKMKAEAEVRGDGDTELQKWFKARMKVMGTTCNWCGCKVENKIYQYAIYSICHLLDKRDTKCPSTKVHPLNYVILCPDHHTMFDNMNWEEREKLGFWETVRDRLIMVYPDLADNERRHFPDSVIKYMNENNPFKL